MRARRCTIGRAQATGATVSSPQRPPRGEHWAVLDQCRLARERVLPCQTHSRTVKSPSRALMTGPAIALMTDRQRKLVSSTCGRERSQRASIPDASRADHNRQASQTSEPSGTPPGVRQQGKDASACRPNQVPREHLVLERDARLNAAHKRRHAVSKLSRALAQHDRSKRRTKRDLSLSLALRQHVRGRAGTPSAAAAT